LDVGGNAVFEPGGYGLVGVDVLKFLVGLELFEEEGLDFLVGLELELND